MAATAATSGYATTLQVDTLIDAYRSIAELVKIAGYGLERTVIEATNLTSPDEWKEFIYGVQMTKAFQAELNYLPLNTPQKDLITDTSSSSIDGDWRLVLPDFGAVTTTVTNSGTTVWISGAAHGWFTGQSIRLTTTGTLPGGFTVGKTYWLRKIGSTSFSLHNTPEDAHAGSSAISASDAGTGTHTANGTSIWTFTGKCRRFTVGDSEADTKLTGTAEFAVTGATSLTPA